MNWLIKHIVLFVKHSKATICLLLFFVIIGQTKYQIPPPATVFAKQWSHWLKITAYTIFIIVIIFT